MANEIVEVKAEENQPEKQGLTLEEYQKKYVRRENAKGMKVVSRMLAVLIGVILFTCLFFVCVKSYEINEYFGYAMIGVSVLFFIFFYIVPVVRIYKYGYFITNVDGKNARAAQRHNKALRKEIADHIIHLHSEVGVIKWYDDGQVGKLAIAVNTNKDDQIKANLTLLFQGSVKKTAQSIIRKSAFRAGLQSAISQQNVLDVALVSATNLKMIKDIIYLYGFRPSDAKLSKIFGEVMMSALAAYGLESTNLGSTVVKDLGAGAKSIPILGGILGTIIDSTIQGLVNAAFTAFIGYQTIKYLEKEYHLQDILDGIELEDEEDLKETCLEVKNDIIQARKKKGAMAS
ncbi:MAG: YcjF family protein [Bacilli bacterium]|nr:YcjF family protein [Bacilli bacterium]